MREPQPLRRALRSLIGATRIGSPLFRYNIGALHRPHYAFLVYQAAHLAHRLGKPRVSVVEFGVAGGRGLLNLERQAEWVEKILPVKIDIYGFDTGEGLPSPKDYRDLPYHWKPGFFRMDQDALRKKLKRAILVLGDVADTAKTFYSKYNPAPVGGVSHDLDYYSSTRDGLVLFDGAPEHQLPRIPIYFDDVIGNEIEFYCDVTGERLAIHEFNASHKSQQISPAYYLRANDYQSWHQNIWILHNFDSPEYNTFVSQEGQQLPIS